MNTRARRIVVPSLVALVLAGLSLAGPLTPPAGPITSTGKTLTEVEPRKAINDANTPGSATATYRIAFPGSYYLTGDVTGSPGKIGILITASDVTLDLNGFTLKSGGSDQFGISASGSGRITIRNGRITGWTGAAAINLSITNHNRIVDVIAFGNLYGIMTGAYSTVSDCVVVGSANFGFGTSTGCVLSNCMAIDNGTDGFSLIDSNQLIGCVARNNFGAGVRASVDTHLSHVLASGNAAGGIITGARGHVQNCTASNNSLDGILVNDSGVIVACEASSNTGDGIRSPSGGCTVRNCTADFNDGNGISMAANSNVSDNTCSNNALDGMVVSSRSIVSGNNCASNGTAVASGAGIHITGSRNRVEGNHCALQDLGVLLDGAANIVLRNTCTGNTTNWSIVASNSVAPIVQAGVNAAAISGNTFAGSLGSTDPNANFTH